MLINHSLTADSAYYTITPSPKVSDRYNILPTADIVSHAVKAGYELHSYQEKRVRKVENRPFCKHIVRLRKPGQLVVGDVVPEIVLVNSHDRSSALQFMLGFFRVVCANGLITGNVFNDLGRILHNHKNPMEAVLDRIDNVFKVSEEKLPVIEQMRQRHMVTDETMDFLQKAALITPERGYENIRELNFINRQDDDGQTLWKTFNRVQENMIKGEARIITQNGRRRKARMIKGIDANVSINQKLWNLAESYLPIAA